MDNEQLKSLYPLGSKLSVIISRVENFGAFTELKENLIGYIPAKEIYWNANIKDVRQELKCGETIEVVVIEYYDNNCVQLSIKKKQVDPWQNIDKEYKIGDDIIGKVISIYENGTIIDIDKRVKGFISISECWIKVDTIEEVLLVDDWVRAKISQIDYNRRIIILSITALFLTEEKVSTGETVLTLGEIQNDIFDQIKYILQKETIRDTGLTSEALKQIKNFLFVESDIESCKSTTLMLRNLGFNCDYALNVDEAFKKIKDNKYDFILSALYMPEKDGVYLARSLRNINSHIPIVFQSVQQELGNYLSELEKLDLENCVLLIPWKFNELVRFINEAAEGTLGNSILNLRAQKDFDFIDKISKPIYGEVKYNQSIEEILDNLKGHTKASFIILFKLNLSTFEVQILSSSGVDIEINERDKYLLRYSAVKDVILGKEMINSKNIKLLNNQKYKHFSPFGNFLSLIGQNIEIISEWGFGLFLFGKDESHFTSEDVKIVKITANILATELERELFENVYKIQHKFIIAGRLSTALIHEINNEQQSLFNNIDILKTDSVNLNAGKIKINDAKFLARFQSVINSLVKEQVKIGSINRLFLNLVREGENEKIDLFEHINELINMFQPIASKKKIEIFVPQVFIPKCNTNVCKLDQVLTNLIINSIEQVATIRNTSGKIWINMNYLSNDYLPFKIEIADNGPGIHSVHLEKVFDIFFTTKSGGTGLGLYISRILIETMKGKISIKDTKRFGGTTFLIGLPKNPLEIL